MKGIILAGGTGSRLYPLTKVTNKHLLPVYNEPMIYSPLNTLISGGIKNILIISGTEHAGHFVSLLRSGKEFGVRLAYEIQDEPGGIAHALSLAKDFAEGETIAVILGDNIFEDDFNFNEFKTGARIFLKKVPDPERFGVAEINSDKIINIEEKPERPKTNYAVTGLYLYDNTVFDKIKNLKPSARGELEISDLNNEYIKEGKMGFDIVKGFWTDAGTFDSLLRANLLVGNKANKGI